MPPRLTAIEFLVTDLDRAVELLVDTVGFPEAARFRHAHFDADVVVLEAEPISIVLLSPTETGAGAPIPLPDDRLSQLVFEPEDHASFAALRDRLATGGASVAHDGAEMFHLSASFMESLFGDAPSLVFARDRDPSWTGAPQPDGDPGTVGEPPDEGAAT